MLLHRLYPREQYGFAFDYMGSAEFEEGGQRRALKAIASSLAEGDIASKCTRFTEQWGRSTRGPIDVVVLGRRAHIAEIGDDMILEATQEAFRVDDVKIVAWLKIDRMGKDDNPMLIVRTNLADAQLRVDQFIRSYLQDHGNDED